MDKLAEQFGALGNWQKIDEKFDETIIKQINDASCVAAMGAILTGFYGLNLTQAKILENIGIWANSELLAKFLNSKETQTGVKWIGGYWDFKLPVGVLEWLIENNKIGAMLRNKSAVGHAIFIDGLDETGLVVIKRSV